MLPLEERRAGSIFVVNMARALKRLGVDFLVISPLRLPSPGKLVKDIPSILLPIPNLLKLKRHLEAAYLIMETIYMILTLFFLLCYRTLSAILYIKGAKVNNVILTDNLLLAAVFTIFKTLHGCFVTLEMHDEPKRVYDFWALKLVINNGQLIVTARYLMKKVIKKLHVEEEKVHASRRNMTVQNYSSMQVRLLRTRM